MSNESDFLVLGSGLAGLLFALRAAEHGRVTVLTKKTRADSNTAWAQGGIAAALGPGRLLRPPRGGHPPGRVRPLATRTWSGWSSSRVPPIIAVLEALGCHFSRGGGEDALAFGREGGHSRRRIVHAGDATGRSIEEALLARSPRTRTSRSSRTTAPST